MTAADHGGGTKRLKFLRNKSAAAYFIGMLLMKPELHNLSHLLPIFTRASEKEMGAGCVNMSLCIAVWEDVHQDTT